jgi:hypothetical protein
MFGFSLHLSLRQTFRVWCFFPNTTSVLAADIDRRRFTATRETVTFRSESNGFSDAPRLQSGGLPIRLSVRRSLDRSFGTDEIA